MEDADVAQAMDIFKESLIAFQGRNDNVSCAKERQAISLTLSHCVRKSLGHSWDVELQDTTIQWCKPKRLTKLRQICPMTEGGEGPADSQSLRASGSSGSNRAN